MKPETGDRRPGHRGIVLRAMAFSVFGLLYPVSGISQCPNGALPPCPGNAGPARTTVAVLPFDNLSRDTNDAYLARDLTDEITGRLIRLDRLTVTSSTVMRRYRGSDDPRAVAQSLRVAYLVSGTVRRDRDRLRISVELLRARDGVAPWTDVFDRRDTSLMDIQIQIAQSVASAITGRLLPEERQQLAVRPTTDPRAYNYLARGRYAQGQRTTRSLLRAVQEYEAALRIDTAFTTAMAYLCSAYGLLSEGYYDSAVVGLSRDTLRHRARDMARRAWRTDSTNATAVAVSASLEPNGSPRRAVLLARAMELDPHNADIIEGNAAILGARGDSAGARELLMRVLAEDPTRSVTLLNLGMGALRSGRHAEAQRWLDSAVAFRPEAYFFYYDRSLAHLRTGDTAIVASDIAEIRRLSRPLAAEALQLLLSLARRDTAAVRTGIATLYAAATTVDCSRNFDCLQVAQALAAAGERDMSLALLERVGPSFFAFWEWIQLAEFDSLRQDPRFQRMATASKPPWVR